MDLFLGTIFAALTIFGFYGMLALIAKIRRGK